MALMKQSYKTYIDILQEELIPALGCTEPIAIAYASAKARELLGEFPEKIIAECSGNIVKNVKGVVVPTTKTLRGISAAAVIGAVGGDASKKLEILTSVTEEDLQKAKELLAQGLCEEKLLETPAKLHIIVRMYSGEHSSLVEIIHTHTGIVRLEKDGETIFSVPFNAEEQEEGLTDRSCLSVEGIYEFAQTVEIDQVKDILDRQIGFNTAIAQEGMHNKYGANVGKSLISAYGDDIKVRARAVTAAGSDARMSGCEMPVVINSGSGNQGMTVSLPVIEYAHELGVSQEKLYRALCISNLIAIHQKTKIGRLSAYCGAVSAAAGAGAGITYLHGGDVKAISMTITNTLANVAGIVCDGAKPSCAAKIASSVDAAVMAFHMAMENRRFCPGEGIIKADIEDTIDSVSRMAKDGMKETDEEILKIMIDS